MDRFGRPQPKGGSLHCARGQDSRRAAVPLRSGASPVRLGPVQDSAFAAAPAPDPELRRKVQARIDHKTKPVGSLGQLETLAAQICLAQNRLDPQVSRAQVLVYAGDHGAAAQGLSAYPCEVTPQMVLNFLRGGAAINVFARLFDLDLKVVDAGVAAALDPHPQLIDKKIAQGTRNLIAEPAMEQAQALLAIEHGKAIAQAFHEEQKDLLILGEMGIGNTSSAALLTHCMTQAPLRQCVGRGTGLSDEALTKKQTLLAQALDRGGSPKAPLSALCEYGGFEIAMMVGTMIRAAQLRQLVLVDGFIVTASALIACELCPTIRPYLIFGHRSHEVGHALSLAHLQASPLLSLDLRLGEGTGAALAYPMVKAAAAFLNEMASFESAGVSRECSR